MAAGRPGGRGRAQASADVTRPILIIDWELYGCCGSWAITWLTGSQLQVRRTLLLEPLLACLLARVKTWYIWVSTEPRISRKSNFKGFMKPPTPRAFPVPRPLWTGLDCFGSKSSICEKAWIAVVLRRSFGVFFFPFCFVFYATTLKEGAFQHSLHLPHSKPIKVNSFPHCRELPREEARLSDFFFSLWWWRWYQASPSWTLTPTHPSPPAGCSTGQRLCIINDIQIPCLKGLVCGLDESISVLPLPSLGGWHHILPPLFTATLHLSLPLELWNNVNEFIRFVTRLTALCFRTGWCVTRNKSLLSPADEMRWIVFVDRENTSVRFGLHEDCEIVTP